MNTANRRALRLTTGLAATALMTGVAALAAGLGTEAEVDSQNPPATPVYRSPLFAATAPDGKTLYVSDPVSATVAFLDVSSKAKRLDVSLNGQPRGLCLTPDGKTLYVAERLAGTVAVIDTAGGKVVDRIAVGRWPVAVALAGKSNRLFVANQENHTVSVVDLGQKPNKIVRQIPAVREPTCFALTPDERFVVVTNLLPSGVSTDPMLAAEVTLIDTSKLEATAKVKLPPGSTSVNGVCTSPDGKWAYVIHSLGHFNLPVTQLERGWVNTYALSIIGLPEGNRLTTVLLDDLTQGAADPFAVVCSKDGARLWISHSGVHEISTVEIGLVHELLKGNVLGNLASLQDGSLPNIWVRIQKDRSVIAELAFDLTALYIADAIHRAPSGGKGPRGIALSPDGKSLFVCNYFSGSVAILNAADGKPQGTIALGPQPEPNAVRRGELFFNDATEAFQHWHSCATCHPNQGRVDGLRWDFTRDGIGNGKDTPSLVFLDKTEPLNRRATRETARDCARTGITTAYMIEPTQQKVDDILAYMISLRPDPSPFLTADGKLTESAQRGKQLFEGKAGCAQCHPAPYFTDKKVHNVGSASDHYMEQDGLYDTPGLVELHRTAPYLHDGRARTIMEVLTVYNKAGKHGDTAGLSPQQLEDLVAYMLSL